jgi:hypothetical protein
MIQITQGGVVVQPGAVEKLRSQYHANGFALMPGFLAPKVLSALLKKLASGEFELKQEEHVKGATMLMPQSDPALIALHFVVNRPELFDIVARIADIPQPGNFTSRLHRTTPVADQHIDWHDDGLDGRILGLNINLTTEPYKGGLLQVRNPTRTITGEIGQLPPGDAFLFRVADGWQHRLTPVAEGERTVAVGWFRTQPDWGVMVLGGLRSSMLVFETVPQ